MHKPIQAGSRPGVRLHGLYCSKAVTIPRPRGLPWKQKKQIYCWQEADIVSGSIGAEVRDENVNSMSLRAWPALVAKVCWQQFVETSVPNVKNSEHRLHSCRNSELFVSFRIPGRKIWMRWGLKNKATELIERHSECNITAVGSIDKACCCQSVQLLSNSQLKFF